MKLLYSWVLLLAGMLTFSQSYEIRGKISDLHDRMPLVNATVILGNLKTQTDLKGNFLFSKVRSGSYELIATHPLCEARTESLVVQDNLFLTLFLEHHAHDIETVNIAAVHENKTPFTVTTLDKAELERHSSENLGNLLGNTAGINVLKTGNNIAKPVIHGLLGSRIFIINNNVKMAEQEWGTEHAPSIDAGAFDHVDVVKGAGTLRFGSAPGGVVVLEPRVFPARDSLEGRIILNGISNGRGGSANTELAKYWKDQWFLKAQGSYKKLGDLSTPDFTLQNTGTEENAFSISAGQRKFTRGFEVYYNLVNHNFGIFTGSHLGNSEDFYNAVNGGITAYTGNFSYQINAPRQEVIHQIFKVEAYKRFSGAGKFTAKYSVQFNDRKEFDIRRGELNDLPAMDLRLTTHQFQFEHLLERGKFELESGQYGSFQNNFPDPVTKTRRLIPDYNRYEGGLFSVLHYRASKQFTWEGGLRFDYDFLEAYKYYDLELWDSRYAADFASFEADRHGVRVLTHPKLHFQNFSANTGFTFSPSEYFNFKLNFARASRSPNAAELFADGLHHSASIIEQGNLAMKPEEINQLNASLLFKKDFLEGFEAEVSPYVMFSENFINQVPTGFQNTIRGNFVVWDFQQIKARLMGIDARAQLQFTPQVKWVGNFSTMRGDDLTHDEPLIQMPPLSFSNVLNFSNEKIFVEAGQRTTLKQKRFPERNVMVDLIENGQAVSRELDLSTPPDAYTLWHAGAGYRFSKHLKLNAEVTNVFNVRYREYLNRLRYFSDALGRNAVVSLILNF